MLIVLNGNRSAHSQDLANVLRPHVQNRESADTEEISPPPGGWTGGFDEPALNVGILLGKQLQVLGIPTVAISFEEMNSCRKQAPGEFEDLRLLQAACGAYGVSRSDWLKRYRPQVQRLIEEMGSVVNSDDSPAVKADKILAWLHDRVFTGGYELRATDLREVLDRGKFNCVSATILFNELARQVGLETSACEWPQHIASCLQTGTHEWVIETTQRPKVHASSRVTSTRVDSPGDEPGVHGGFQPPKNAQTTPGINPRRLSDTQLLAVVFYNRALDHLSHEDYPAGLAANWQAVVLDPDNRYARANLLAIINNWAVAEAKAQRYAEALRLLQLGEKIDGSYPPFQANYARIQRRLAQQSTEGLRAVPDS